MIGTYASWLPGDKRGFRNRGHRIHSSGDYRNPPPLEEHAGLRNYNLERAGKKVEIPLGRRAALAKAIARLLTEAGYRVLVVSVSGCHAHLLAELPVDLAEFKRVIAHVKMKSSRTLKDVLPGRVWSRGDKHILVNDDTHLAEEYGYIRDRQGPGARSWCEGEALE
jgi:REP element-mobilizing transposase RayT